VVYTLPNIRLLKCSKLWKVTYRQRRKVRCAMVLPVLIGINSQKGPPNEVARPSGTALPKETTIPRGVRRNCSENVWVILKHMLLYWTLSLPKFLQPSKAKSLSNIIHPWSLLPVHTHLKSTIFFHKDKGHETEDCYVLKKEIKRLIAKGYLR
jgi:hypothetical protein